MKQLVKILLILVVAIGLGFFFGVYNTPQAVEVYNASGQLISSTSAQTIGSVFVPGLKIESIPWYVSRSSAIAAYLLLFSIIAWGLGMAIGFTYRFVDPARAWQVHQDMSMSFGVLVFVHAFSLLFDKFMNFDIFDILIPFYSNYKTWFLSLGIVGFYLLLLIIISSVFLRLSSPRFWRFSHYLVYPLFLFATIHGLQLGTDSSTMIMQTVYKFAGAVIVILFVYRFTITLYQNRIK
ncbi:MAG: ferric reductase-like transmembrane domain-containing protein [bacterium]